MAAFKLSIVSPQRTVFEDDVNAVVLPAHDGYLGVLSSHEPTIAALRPGVLEYVDTTGTRRYISLEGGFVEVEIGKVIVLADGAERSDEIDEVRAQELLDEARRALRGESSSMTAQEAARQVDIAMNRIKASRMN